MYPRKQLCNGDFLPSICRSSHLKWRILIKLNCIFHGSFHGKVCIFLWNYSCNVHNEQVCDFKWIHTSIITLFFFYLESKLATFFFLVHAIPHKFQEYIVFSYLASPKLHMRCYKTFICFLPPSFIDGEDKSSCETKINILSPLPIYILYVVWAFPFICTHDFHLCSSLTY